MGVQFSASERECCLTAERSGDVEASTVNLTIAASVALLRRLWNAGAHRGSM